MARHLPVEILDFEIGSFGPDFEIGALGSKLKKGLKKVGGVVDKVTDVTIMKPTVAVMGAVGGKKGKELGKKIGGLASKVTKVATLAGAAGAALPALAPLATSPLGLAVGGKLIKDAVTKKKASGTAKAATEKSVAKSAVSVKASGEASSCPSTDNALAAKVGAALVAKLGGPLNKANKALQLANLQRTATSEHNRLMQDADFRKKVLTGITTLAAKGDGACERTVRVLIGR